MHDRSSDGRGARSLAGWVVLFLVVAVVGSAVAATLSAVPALADETPTPLGDVSASPSADPSASPSAEPSPDPSASVRAVLPRPTRSRSRRSASSAR